MILLFWRSSYFEDKNIDILRSSGIEDKGFGKLKKLVFWIQNIDSIQSWYFED